MQRLLLLLLALRDVVSYKPVSVIHPVHIIIPLPLEESSEELKNPFKLSILKVRPVVDLALDDAYRKFQYVPPDSMAITYRDSRLSDAHGPNVAIQQLVKNRLDCIIGYAFVYALAPVARMCPYWQDDDSNGIPVITSIGLTMNLDNKEEYQTLTRISGPYKVVAQSVFALFKYHGWMRHVFLFHHVKGSAFGECFLLMASIQHTVKQILHMEHNFFTFNQNEYVSRSQF
uniref:ANF_receptor domain-containing protein n=1 Tax=Haemonchus contortus TaxID=6289 RepID=A0A7I4XUC4_HAECO